MNNIYKSSTPPRRRRNSASPTPSPSATNISRSNGNQACAACKYQRRKCAPDCILAPYFPHHRQRQFLNAHKLFGVSNITKIIRYLDQPHKDQAMRTIIYQSDVRANDPVGGCYRIIRDLQRQIEYARAELHLVLHQLAICRAQTQQQRHNNENDLIVALDHHHHQNNDNIINNNDNDNDNGNDNNRGLNHVLGSFDVININNYDDHLEQAPHEDDHRHQQQNYLFQNVDDDEAHDYSWPGIQNSNLTTELAEVKQSNSTAANECQEEDVKTLLHDVGGGNADDEIQEFKFDFDEKSSIDNVHNHLRLKTTV